MTIYTTSRIRRPATYLWIRTQATGGVLLLSPKDDWLREQPMQLQRAGETIANQLAFTVEFRLLLDRSIRVQHD